MESCLSGVTVYCPSTIYSHIADILTLYPSARQHATLLCCERRAPHGSDAAIAWVVHAETPFTVATVSFRALGRPMPGVVHHHASS